MVKLEPKSIRDVYALLQYIKETIEDKNKSSCTPISLYEMAWLHSINEVSKPLENYLTGRGEPVKG